MAESSVEGLSALLHAMDQIPKGFETKRGGPLRRALRMAADKVRDEARVRVPVRTGALRNNIVSELDNNPQRSGVNERFRVGVRGGARVPYADTKRNRRMRRVGETYQLSSSTFYWRFLEFGSENIKRPRPFLRPAFEATKVAALEIVIDESRRGLEKIVKRLSRPPRKGKA